MYSGEAVYVRLHLHRVCDRQTVCFTMSFPWGGGRLKDGFKSEIATLRRLRPGTRGVRDWRLKLCSLGWTCLLMNIIPAARFSPGYDEVSENHMSMARAFPLFPPHFLFHWLFCFIFSHCYSCSLISFYLLFTHSLSSWVYRNSYVELKYKY